MMPSLDLDVLALLRKVRLATIPNLRFWLKGRDPTPSINRLERTGHVEHVGPGEPCQHWRAVKMMEGC